MSTFLVTLILARDLEIAYGRSKNVCEMVPTEQLGSETIYFNEFFWRINQDKTRWIKLEGNRPKDHYRSKWGRGEFREPYLIVQYSNSP